MINQYPKRTTRCQILDICNISPQRYKLFVVGILVLAFLLRLVFALESGITGDEANYVMIARCSAWDILSGAALDPSNPPLYMLLLHWLMAVSAKQVWVWKMMSVAMNLGMIYLMIVLLRRLVGNGIALMAGFLAAINPWQVYTATEIRGYAMVGLCGLVAIEAADRFKRNGSLPWAGLWALACAAGFYTHYSMVVIALVTGFDTLIRFRHQWRHLLVWLAAGAAAMALMFLWVPVMLQQSISHGGRAVHIWHLAGFPIVQCLGTTYLRPGLSVAFLAIGGSAALAVFAPPLVAGLLSLWRRNRSVLLLFIVLFVTAVAVPLARSAVIGSISFSTRYTFVASISVFLLLACGLNSFGKRLRVVFLLSIVVLSAISLAQFRWKYVTRSAGNEAVSMAQKIVGDDEALLVPDIYMAMRARYHSDGGFPHCFITARGGRNPAKLEPTATWLDARNFYEYSDRFYTTSAREQLHSFKVVWYWQIGTAPTAPAALGQAYQTDGEVELTSGGQFGAEQPAKLIRYRRIDSSEESE